MKATANKLKLINDPVYGFIKIPSPLIFDLMEHPWFQRLRRIKQLGLTHLVYPGALHTRFHHALGAMWLTTQALDTLKSKGVQITDEETEATIAAVLLHDIGHGPFSHTLEKSIVLGVGHEDISLALMEFLNKEFNGKLNLAIKIFQNKYRKQYLHQLISSQLDMDRMDYLRRDSFFTGVVEGTIGSERIIKMLDVVKNQLVIEAKGIYSIEKFIIARRLMYWQVYLHKTVLSAEQLLSCILKRARFLAQNNIEVFATPAFRFFLQNTMKQKDFLTNRDYLDLFCQLDDNDITASIKVWQKHPDKVLRLLSDSLINRQLFAVSITTHKGSENQISKLKARVMDKLKISAEDAAYFVMSGVVENSAYIATEDNIKIKMQNGKLTDLAKASDQYNISALSKTVRKYFICYPDEVE